jgi:hypothetical protein
MENVAKACKLTQPGEKLMAAKTPRSARADIEITGPILGTPVLMLAEFDLRAQGYLTEEYFVSGDAVSYQPVGPLSEDGNWQVAPAETAPYRTRIVVVRPADASKFNGTVVVEWLNVSRGIDFAPDWICLHREIMRSGFAYVGVSAQRVGLEGGLSLEPDNLPLKQADPARYHALSHPGDAFAYDIFSQAGMIIKGSATGKVLGPLTAKRLLAIGDSQSAIFLTTYVNAIDRLARVYDGFFIHARFAPGAPLDGASILNSPTTMPQSARLCSDLRVPTMTVLAETDVIGANVRGFFHARQDDNDLLRIWEIAGASHANNYLATVGFIDSSSASIPELAAAYAPTDDFFGMKLAKAMDYDPQQHYVMESALLHLDRWTATDKAPPKGPRLETIGGDKDRPLPQLVLDANGNAKGGIRTPWVDVPIARMSGIGNSGSVAAGLTGVTEPFDHTTLGRLYPGGRDEYLAKFRRALDSAIESGFILPADRAEIELVAAAMYPTHGV